MKLTNLLASLALLVGAATSTAFADTDCTGPFASAMNDDCHGTPPPPPPPSRVTPECPGYYQVTLTAQQVFPELASNLQRAATDLDRLRRQFAVAPSDDLRRQIWMIENYRDQTLRYLARVGPQTVRDVGCMSLARAIGIARARLGAPAL